MSKLRSVNTHFWADNYVIDLDPIEKLLFLYMLTNANTNMLGIYELHARKIAFDTGIDKEMVVKIFGRFERDGRATLYKGFVTLHNHLKHQNFNSNMGISAISTFNNLPEHIKNKALEVGVLDLLKEICKPLQKGSKPIIKGLEPFGKIEVEYEVEVEGELEVEDEREREFENGPRSRIIKTLKGIKTPDQLKPLKRVDGFAEAYLQYRLYLKDSFSRWPNEVEVIADFMKLKELMDEGNNPVKVIWQTIQAKNKSFYPIKDFDTKNNAQTENRMNEYQEL